MKTHLTSLALLLPISLAGLLAVSLTSCSEGDSSGGSAAGPPDGAKLFSSQQCKTCHGGSGAGMPGMGPSVVGIGERWTREGLADYLADPAAVRKTIPHLAESSTKYRMPMPKSGLDREALLILADYVLALK